MEALRVEKPPVAMVAKAWQSASSRFMPPSMSRPASTAREQGVDAPEDGRRLAQAGAQAVGAGAGHLAAEHLVAAHAHGREDRQRQRDDAHAAQPVRERAPEEQAARQGLDVGEDGGASGGEAAHHLEVGVRESGQEGHGSELAALLEEPDQEGDGAHQGQAHPAQRDDGEALAHALLVAMAAVQPLQRRAEDERENDGGGEGQALGAFEGHAAGEREVVPDGDAQGHEQDGGQDLQEPADGVKNRAAPHRRSLKSP